MKFTIARMVVLACACVCRGQNAAPPASQAGGPEAVATNADVSYCFSPVRGLDPGHEPPPFIELELHVRVSYRNHGTSPLIVPLERTRTVYTGLKPEALSVFRESRNPFELAVKPMKELPSSVNRDNPIDPENDVFAVIPADGEMTPLLEDLSLPVTRTGFFKKYPDLRGHRVDIKLQFVHQPLAAALRADLSNRWASFGVPWTGTLTTNTFLVDVPENPPATARCIDRQPDHPVSSHDRDVQSGK
jgi:hypothetical protein